MTILRAGTYLTPSIPVEFFETILQHLETKLEIHSTLLYESRCHGPRLDIEDPFKSGYLDLAWMTASAYLNLVDNKVPIELLPVTSTHIHNMGEGCFTDVIIHKDLKNIVKEFIDLRGYGFAYDMPHSTNSQIITLSNLKNIGENHSFFKGVLFSGSHWNSIKAVVEKKVEAAAVDANCLAFFLKRNESLEEEIEVLTSWGPLPPYACVVRSALPCQLKKDVVECLCNMHTDEDGRKKLSNFNYNVDRFSRVNKDAFEEVTNMEKRFKDYPIAIPQWTQLPDVCYDGPKGRVPWIIAKRQPDYGWKEHTHRANIALAVNAYRGETKDELEQMKQQLEVEVTKALMRNSESPIHDNDLALFIHSLIATNINPRNFHGIDLVADLQLRVNNASEPHPFLVLALCNSYAVDFSDLSKLRKVATIHQNSESRREIEMKALALKAFACAATLPGRELNKFEDDMKKAAKCLVSKQSIEDGSFGNAYTTSLVVQALIAAGRSIAPAWNQTSAFDFLLKESVIEVNMIKAYYIEMALNSRNVTFIKDLYDGEIEGPKPPESSHYVQYSVKGSERPDTYFSVTTKVPIHANFFSIMDNIAKQSNKFEFAYYLNLNKEPMVYKMIGIPNDAEANLFWRICVQRNGKDETGFYSDQILGSPVKLIPGEHKHIIMWYRDSDCPSKRDESS